MSSRDDQFGQGNECVRLSNLTRYLSLAAETTLRDPASAWDGTYRDFVPHSYIYLHISHEATTNQRTRSVFVINFERSLKTSRERICFACQELWQWFAT